MMSDKTKVLVVWHDAHSETEGSWCEEGDISDEPCIVESMGFLLPDKKRNHVVLAQSVAQTKEVDGVLCIPVGMVQKMVVLGFVAHDVPPFGIVAGAGVAR
jgi:hypothetical protein